MAVVVQYLLKLWSHPGIELGWKRVYGIELFFALWVVNSEPDGAKFVGEDDCAQESWSQGRSLDFVN